METVPFLGWDTELVLAGLLLAALLIVFVVMPTWRMPNRKKVRGQAERIVRDVRSRGH